MTRYVVVEVEDGRAEEARLEIAAVPGVERADLYEPALRPVAVANVPEGRRQ